MKAEGAQGMQGEDVGQKRAQGARRECVWDSRQMVTLTSIICYMRMNESTNKQMNEWMDEMDEGMEGRTDVCMNVWKHERMIAHMKRQTIEPPYN